MDNLESSKAPHSKSTPHCISPASTQRLKHRSPRIAQKHVTSLLLAKTSEHHTILFPSPMCLTCVMSQDIKSSERVSQSHKFRLKFSRREDFSIGTHEVSCAVTGLGEGMKRFVSKGGGRSNGFGHGIWVFSRSGAWKL